MKMEMTQRDKQLLVFLSIFVIVVCFGYWGIYPNIKAMKKMETKMQEQQDIKTVNETKIMQVPMFEVDNEKMEKSILDARAKFYPMMNSSEIDKYFTNFVLGYQLYAYDMGITMPEGECELEPYQYSEKALNEQQIQELSESADSTQEQSDSATALDEGSDSEEDMYAFDATAMTGIYMATVSLRLGGTDEQLLKLIDDLSNTDMKHRVKNYSWSIERSVQYTNNADEEKGYEIAQENVLNITLEIYMCEE